MPNKGPDQRAQWVPVYLSEHLASGGVIRTFSDNVDIALWRSFSGKIHAWANRCPHRGMRLSYGFVRGEMLACIYHGWHYGDYATCQHIPAHPDLKPPETICATTYGCVEKDGLIWISTGDGSPTNPQNLPAYPLRSIVIDTCATEVAAKLGLEGFNRGSVRIQATQCVCAIQELPDKRTNLHILSRKKLAPLEMVKLSRWAEKLRRTLEAACHGPQQVAT